MEIRKIAEENQFDYLLIESTGISEPLPVAETFTVITIVSATNILKFTDDKGVSLSDVATLGTKFRDFLLFSDTMVTTIDCLSFWEYLGSTKTLSETKEKIGEDDNRNIVDLLIDQIEFANVILLNKTDLISVLNKLTFISYLFRRMSNLQK